MTDEKLIHDFLDKNYYVKTSETYFVVCERDTYKTITSSDFAKIFQTIFGDFISIYNETSVESSIEIYYKWFNINKRLTTKNLSDFMDKLDFKKGSAFLLKKIQTKFKKDERFNAEFIENYFNDVYIEKELTPKLESIIKNFNSHNNSNYLLKPFTDELKFETIKINQYAMNHLNKWYAETIIGEKVNDILNQLVITLGPRNWIVTWIGHGKLTREKLLKDFILEDEYHHKHILRMYDKWYETAVIEASERVLNRNNYGNSFPSLTLGREF
jgi:hypothetical protein